MNLRLKGLQGVLFFGNFSFSYPLQIVNDLNTWSDNLFDGDPVIPPLPGDSPVDFPRAILNSADKRFSLRISLARLDFFHKIAQDSVEDLQDIQVSYWGHFEKIIKNIKEYYRVKIGRIACVGTFSMHTSDNPNVYIYKKFLSANRFFGNTRSLEIHALHKETIEENELHVNRWFRIKATDKPHDERKNILTIEIDINTLQEEAETKNFTFEEMQQFYRLAFARFAQYIDECFQEDDSHV